MEKILLAVNAINPDKHSLAFACFLGRMTNSPITAIFLEDIIHEEILPPKALPSVALIESRLQANAARRLTNQKLMEKHIAAFTDIAEEQAVNFSFHRDKGVPSYEIIKESRFADLLVVDAGTSFKSQSERTPTDFVKEVLEHTECPVVIAPEDFESIDEIIFTYNGSASSVFAIKQFTYLFPQLRSKKISVISINETGEWDRADLSKLKELLQNYYADLHFEVLKGTIYKTLFEYVFQRRHALLVMGAYGRNALSRFFTPSRADLVINTVPQPIFIAHL